MCGATVWSSSSAKRKMATSVRMSITPWQAQVQDLTDRIVKEIDASLESKEEEIMQV